jgi:hypothetical protein
MRRYLLALFAALTLVLGAYAINPGNEQTSRPGQSRVLPNTSGFSLH